MAEYIGEFRHVASVLWADGHHGKVIQEEDSGRTRVLQQTHDGPVLIDVGAAYGDPDFELWCCEALYSTGVEVVPWDLLDDSFVGKPEVFRVLVRPDRHTLVEFYDNLEGGC